MNKFQNVKFRSVADCLEYIPEHQLRIVEALREIVFDTLPGVKERLSYNVPFYYRNSRICYIWPGAVPWGTVSEGVSFGFCRGALLADEDNFFPDRHKKEVRSRVYYSEGEIEDLMLRKFLAEAMLLDEEFARDRASRGKLKRS